MQRKTTLSEPEIKHTFSPPTKCKDLGLRKIACLKTLLIKASR
jgi:hypothetical protein